MASIISIEFSFRGNQHYVLISSRQSNEKLVYRITVMNGELERLISDCNIIEEVNGQLQYDDCNGNREKAALKNEIIDALAAYLHKNSVSRFQLSNRASADQA